MRTTKKIVLFTIFAILIFLYIPQGSCAHDNLLAEQTPAPLKINLNHLDFLNSKIKTPKGKKLNVWAIYSEPEIPGNIEGAYKYVTALGEGISCVDDVARAAIVYLKYYEYSNDKTSLDRAKEALDFIIYMQTPKGLFYNFIFFDGTINKKGITSKESLDFWTLRGFWALTEGYRIFYKIDPLYAKVLKKHIDLVVSYLDPSKNKSPLYGYGKFSKTGGAPLWLINNGTDQSALAVIALCNIYEIDPSIKIKEIIEKLIDGMICMQGKEPAEFPFCSFPSWINSPNVWHAWGSRQMMALAKAGRIFKNPLWMQSAELEANNWIIHLVASRGLIFAIGPAPIIYPSQPYGAEVLVTGLLELNHATGKENYAVMAGLMASWFMGNNEAKEAVYNEDTGRVYDGIDDGKLNYNSGAEAVVSGLLALLAVKGNPVSEKYLLYKEKNSFNFIVIEPEAGKFISGPIKRVSRISGPEGMYSSGGYIEMREKSRLMFPFQIEKEGDYIPYLAYSASGDGSGTLSVNFGKNVTDSIKIEGNTNGFLKLLKLPAIYLDEDLRDLTLAFNVASEPFSICIDAIILQKVIEERTLVNPKGYSIRIFKSFDDKERTVKFNPSKNETFSIRIFDNKGKEKNNLFDSLKPQFEIKLPPYGYCFILLDPMLPYLQ